MKRTTVFLLTLGSLGFSFLACSKSEAPKPAANQQATIASQPADGTATPVSALGEPSSTTSDSTTAKKKIDACTLLTSPEIRSIQDESLQETKASGAVEGGLSISQCFYALPTFTKSINLVITQRADGTGARDPKDFWEATFDKESERERERKRDKRSKKDDKEARGRNREEEEEGEAAPPQKIEGLGDEAFWTGGRVGGALYVLKGNAFLRVTVGDSGNQQTNINKSKALARLALKRI
jgi:hypothetical protein